MIPALLTDAIALVAILDYPADPNRWPGDLHEAINSNHEAFYRFFTQQMEHCSLETVTASDEHWLTTLVFFSAALTAIIGQQEEPALRFRLGLIKALRCQFALTEQEAEDTLHSLPAALEHSAQLQQVWKQGALCIGQLSRQQRQATLRLSGLLRKLGAAR